MNHHLPPGRGDCEFIFATAVEAGSPVGITAALSALAVHHPGRATHLRALLTLGLAASVPGTATAKTGRA